MPNTGRIVWDETGKHFYETGLDRGVLFPMDNGVYGTGVAWNGLTSVSENPSGAESTALYADNTKYLNLISNEDFGATLECYYYPDEFEPCNGVASLAAGVTVGQQTRKKFGLAYRTRLGNDTEADSYGYKIHLVYNCTAAPSSKSYNTVNESPEAATLSYEITTTPVDVPNGKPSATITIDSTKVDAAKLATFEDILYGKDGETPTAPRLPLPSEIATIFAQG